jgi:hypothetical protein
LNFFCNIERRVHRHGNNEIEQSTCRSSKKNTTDILPQIQVPGPGKHQAGKKSCFDRSPHDLFLIRLQVNTQRLCRANASFSASSLIDNSEVVRHHRLDSVGLALLMCAAMRRPQLGELFG